MRNMIFMVMLLILFNSSLFSQLKNKNNPEAIAKQFIEKLSNGEYEIAYNYFDNIVKNQFKLPQLEGLWQMLKALHGDFESITNVEGSNYLDNRIVILTTSFNLSIVKFRIVVNADGLIIGFVIDSVTSKKPYSPPEYADTTNIIEIPTEFGEEGFKLKGIITIPKNKDNYPLLILVHGSGPQDMDESFGPNKIFKDIALGLASKGIAVFRYEKRTKVHGEKIGTDIDIDKETVDDAVLAVKHISEQKSINPTKIFLLGHSLGGYMAPKIAQRAKELSGIILMAGSLSPLEDLILMQIRYLAEIKGEPSQEEIDNINKISRQREFLKKSNLADDTPVDSLPLGVPPSYWRSLRNYQPDLVAKQIDTPTLVLQAEMDYQVPQSEFEKWRKALSGRKNTDFVMLKGLNHLFMKSEHKGYEDYFKEGHVSNDLIQTVGDWILKK